MKEQEPPPPPVVPEVPIGNGRAKSTVDLKSFGKKTPKEEKSREEIKVVNSSPLADRPLMLEELRLVWEEFAETRKHQAAEYQLLRREFALLNGVVTIPLSNPIEEPLLQTIRLQLTTYLREKLSNQSVTVSGELREASIQKNVYTSKEKFEHLLGKNPALRELQEKFGLDYEY